MVDVHWLLLAHGVIRGGIVGIVDTVRVETKVGTYLIGNADRSYGTNCIYQVGFIVSSDVDDLGNLTNCGLMVAGFVANTCATAPSSRGFVGVLRF